MKLTEKLSVKIPTLSDQNKSLLFPHYQMSHWFLLKELKEKSGHNY